MAERTYLELSEDEGSAHKFYEVIVDGADVQIRYGRIGTDGRTSTKTYGSAEAAASDAAKKIAAKIKKGYERAVMGVRQRRSVTRREIVSQAAEANTTAAPVLWRFDTKRSAFGVFVDEDAIWVGNEDGEIYKLDHGGEVQRKFKLPDGVKCIVSDDDWLYAGCDDGRVYDLTGKMPMVSYVIDDDVDIYWLDISDGVLGVSDDKGFVTVINHEDESQWRQQSAGRSGWMVRCDEIGVYHGHARGVTMYDWEDGSEIWHQATDGAVLFGWQEESSLFACTSKNKVHVFSKTGAAGHVLDCDSSVFSCAAAPGGHFVFAGDNRSSVYCFDEQGQRLWKLDSGCGSAFSMQFFHDKLYLVTTEGVLACIDASEQAIADARQGRVPEARDIKASASIEADAQGVADDVSNLESVSASDAAADDEGGIIVECVNEGGKLRIRVISEGYEDWHVQFPKNIRVEGARYLVEELREAGRGNYYRAFGEIRRLDD